MLKGSTAAEVPLAIPTGCTGSAPGSALGGATSDDPIAGAWTSAKISESQIVRAFVALGGSEKEGHSFFISFGTGNRKYAVFTLRFQDGSWEAFETGGDDPIHEDDGTYEIGNDTFEYMPVFILAAIFYAIVSIPVSRAVQHMEGR